MIQTCPIYGSIWKQEDSWICMDTHIDTYRFPWNTGHSKHVDLYMWCIMLYQLLCLFRKLDIIVSKMLTVGTAKVERLCKTNRGLTNRGLTNIAAANLLLRTTSEHKTRLCEFLSPAAADKWSQDRFHSNLHVVLRILLWSSRHQVRHCKNRNPFHQTLHLHPAAAARPKSDLWSNLVSRIAILTAMLLSLFRDAEECAERHCRKIWNGRKNQQEEKSTMDGQRTGYAVDLGQCLLFTLDVFDMISQLLYPLLEFGIRL